MQLLFLILLFIFISMVRNKNKAPNKGAAPDVPRAPRPVQRPDPVPVERVDGSAPQPGPAPVERAERPAEKRMTARELRRLRAQLLEARRREQEMSSMEPAFAQGASAFDDEGCVGGSLAHDHTEGEDRAEHARHKEEVKRREAVEALEHAQAANAAAVNVRRLRQAVVMAEVLDRPKALRARGYGRRAV